MKLYGFDVVSGGYTHKVDDTEVLAQEFNFYMGEYKNNPRRDAAAEALIKGMFFLRAYLEVKHATFGDPYFDMLTFVQALETKKLGSQRRVLERQFMEGCFIEGLIRFGAIPNATHDFMKGYTTIAKSAAKKSHSIFREAFYLDESWKSCSNDVFIEHCWKWILEFSKKYEGRKFPDKKSVLHVGDAAKRLVEKCNSIAAMVSAGQLKARTPICVFSTYEKPFQSFVDKC